jgi:hypothetical protein
MSVGRLIEKYLAFSPNLIRLIPGMTWGADTLTGTTVTAGTLTATTIAVGSGTAVTKILTGSTTWDPANLANLSAESKEVTVTGAVTTDRCLASLSTMDAEHWLIAASVKSTNTVNVTIFNVSGGDKDHASGTVTVTCVRSA